MRDQVAQVRPDLLDMALEAVGVDPFLHVDEGTQFAQPAIFCASLAGWDALGRPQTEFMAGHSLGEVGALVAAGAISERDGLRLVALRGRVMQEAGQVSGAGGMIAVVGANAADRAERLAAEVGLAIANENSPQQVVLSGPRELLRDAEETASKLGLRAIMLPVTGAFHSPMMASAVPQFRAALKAVEIDDERAARVISAATAEPFDDVRVQLTQALTGPVRWCDVLMALHRRGVTRFVEVGPGRVLIHLAKRTLRNVELISA